MMDGRVVADLWAERPESRIRALLDALRNCV
jgi:hypothetical protein